MTLFQETTGRHLSDEPTTRPCEMRAVNE